MAQKAVLLVLDGLGDLPAPKLTPLQMAKKPNMDKMAAKGVQGLMSTISRGVVPGSDTAHLQILGYEPQKHYPGRGPLEALGAGIGLQEGDVAFRANFATVSGNRITDRRAGRLDTGAARELVKEANMRIEDVDVIFKSTVEHRGALVLRGRGLSANVSPTDPHKLGEMEACKPLDLSAEARKTADIINKYTRAVQGRLGMSRVNSQRKAKKLPVANIVLVRGAGTFRKVPAFREVHGITGACVAGGALYKGVARFIGMDVVDVPGATGTKATDLRAKGVAAQKALRDHDFVFVHVKATDSFSHDKDAKGKAKFLEKVDRELIPLLVKTEAAVVVTGDHSTACARGEHTGYEVPVLACEAGGRADGLKKFDEINAMNGGLGHVRGKDIMPVILNMIGKGRMYGT